MRCACTAYYYAATSNMENNNSTFNHAITTWYFTFTLVYVDKGI